ncbi:LacI family transcriptional regulator [Rhodoferax koreense]|uniref:LacI family transcriptional regulator n=1 Tax=Rhodoferax koreensis TaxID=1842727 RepID=A0A1P8K2H6_9BURK|nr:tripartite tricarboxylate transporter substrate binding protein [Rhodoferax koreense]APW40186.1 LacI family transcriptional regulator [Rhodoferax koreense]
MKLNHRAWAIAACVFATATAVQAQPQDFPNKPIHIVVPLPPGGSNDVLARVLGQKMAEAFGQPVVVDNKPGAAGNIATEFMSRVEADGYTIAVAPNQTVAVNPVLYPKLPFDVQRDLQGISMMGRVPMVLVVSSKVSATSVADLITQAKAAPDKFTYASAGAGSPQHMAAEVFKSMTGTRLTQIPYKGSAPALVDVLGGTVDVMFCPINSALPHIRSGKIRALGTTGTQRLEALLPGVPTIAETVPNYESDIWIGMVAPAKTPQPIIAKLNAELRRSLALPDVRAKLAEQGIYAETSTPAEFSALIASDQKRWAAVIKAANIVPE